jgi:hypothetical protein
MKPLIIMCGCGKVRKFGEWVTLTPGQNIAINSGTYKKLMQNCTACQVVPGTSNRLLPVQEV